MSTKRRTKREGWTTAAAADLIYPLFPCFKYFLFSCRRVLCPPCDSHDLPTRRQQQRTRRINQTLLLVLFLFVLKETIATYPRSTLALLFQEKLRESLLQGNNQNKCEQKCAQFFLYIAQYQIQFKFSWIIVQKHNLQHAGGIVKYWTSHGCQTLVFFHSFSSVCSSCLLHLCFHSHYATALGLKGINKQMRLYVWLFRRQWVKRWQLLMTSKVIVVWFSTFVTMRSTLWIITKKCLYSVPK